MVHLTDGITKGYGFAMVYLMDSRDAQINIVLSLERWGDGGFHISTGTATDLLSLMREAIRVAEGEANQWEVVGFIDVPYCERIDYLEDSSCQLILQASHGVIALTFRYNPRSGMTDWPLVLSKEMVRELADFLSEAVRRAKDSAQ